MSEELIRKTYYDPETGFTGVDKLYRILKSKGVTKKQIQDFLKKQEIYQTSKKNTGKMASFIPQYPLQELQLDLIYLENKHLNKARYGLVAIDPFTKKATVELLKKKSATDVTEAMKKVFDELGIPEMVYTDEGSEFVNKDFHELMDQNKVKHITTLRHASVAERFNRTLKELLYKYLQSTSSKTITNVLPKILKNYNNSYHKTIGMAPNDVNVDNLSEVWENIKKHSVRHYRPLLNPGDKVRIQLKEKSFNKGYKPKFSKEIYTVDGKDGMYYRINGLNRLYLRAFLQLVKQSEKNPYAADLEGTREQQIKNIKKHKVIESITPPMHVYPKRERKKPEILLY